MHGYIKERTVQIALYVVQTKSTVRSIAKRFGVSKSTVHHDLTVRLPLIDDNLAKEVNDVLQYNKRVRHIRGGIATRKKYDQIRQKDTVK